MFFFRPTKELAGEMCEDLVREVAARLNRPAEEVRDAVSDFFRQYPQWGHPFGSTEEWLEAAVSIARDR